MPFNQIIELDCITYRKLLRDAMIHSLEQTEEGREYLTKCWRLTQVKPDYNKIKEKYKC